jgi:hypothetical protein
MNLPDALRFLEHEANCCLQRRHAGDRDAGEMLCLLVPALVKVFHLPTMTEQEASDFRNNFRRLLQEDFRFDGKPSRVGCGGAT